MKAPVGDEGPAEATAGEVRGQSGQVPSECPFEWRKAAVAGTQGDPLLQARTQGPSSHLCLKSTGLFTFPSCPRGNQFVRNHVGKGPVIQGQQGTGPLL